MCSSHTLFKVDAETKEDSEEKNEKGPQRQ